MRKGDVKIRANDLEREGCSKPLRPDVGVVFAYQKACGIETACCKQTSSMSC